MGYIHLRRLNQAKTKKRETTKSTKKIEENRETRAQRENEFETTTDFEVNFSISF